MTAGRFGGGIEGRLICYRITRVDSYSRGSREAGTPLRFRGGKKRSGLITTEGDAAPRNSAVLALGGEPVRVRLDFRLLHGSRLRLAA